MNSNPKLPDRWWLRCIQWLGNSNCTRHLVEMPPEQFRWSLRRCLSKRLINHGLVLWLVAVVQLCACQSAIGVPSLLNGDTLLVANEWLQSRYGIPELPERALVKLKEVVLWNTPELNGNEDFECVPNVSDTNAVGVNEAGSEPKDGTKDNSDESDVSLFYLCLFMATFGIGFLAAYAVGWWYISQHTR